jgi:hypothetical protein
MTENIQVATVTPQVANNNHTQQTAENPSGAPLKEEVKTEEAATEQTTEAAPAPQPEQETKSL